MYLTAVQITELIQGALTGDPCFKVYNVAGIKEAKEGDITFLANSKYANLLANTNASVIIVPLDVDVPGKTYIKVKDPSLAFMCVVKEIMGDLIKHPEGIHTHSVISPKAKLSDNVAVGAFAVIEDDVIIGENSIIYSGAYIGRQTVIGNNCVIYPNVTVRERSQIGSNVIIHSGTVIGSDGFGYVEINGRREKIPQVGVVVIEDDVEIGSNVAVDRARFDKTIIGKGTKIDNLVQIAHNVRIGENCVIVSQAGVSGSTIVKDRAILAGQSGVVGHITIGANAIVAAQAGVTKSVPDNTMVSGYPAKPHKEAMKVNACLQKLPQLYKQIQDLQKRIEELEAKF
ncbi:MAG: UDP-3-O-(3-hydroxymyristoyl)glucosamine N-acyltransferase [Candidatus Omnitrophica bacterium]|nr:UDP-3-O-(3-hydroxymyristoyl)glucosamine N-acyltransferase [Candidatus Omnitrophota bacterium]MDD5080414.1 UDP-3-O-(3-hydroxymyristoyl)glucosamine N-acyltransferase [Candidatus Omnitrophota bacterium]MDD5441094.1 UDP-3-O-(3-hydroxymyristoyl)glucosamine N-acyltransferase [Candidatus Omnitrophota bacterium]